MSLFFCIREEDKISQREIPSAFRTVLWSKTIYGIQMRVVNSRKFITKRDSEFVVRYD